MKTTEFINKVRKVKKKRLKTLSLIRKKKVSINDILSPSTDNPFYYFAISEVLQHLLEAGGKPKSLEILEKATVPKERLIGFLTREDREALLTAIEEESEDEVTES
ncbi:MAG: hypothetical protein QXH08_00270 [Candidatus Hadarchaeales archaeon]